MSGIGLVFNPRAGSNKRDPGAPVRLARQLGDHGIVAAPRSLDELARAAEDFRRQKIEVLGIAGGDGTNHVTLTGFHDVYGKQPLPTVAFLRGGTMNNVANSLKLPKGRVDGLLDRLVRRYLETPNLPVHQQSMLEVEGKLGFLWGIGVIPAFLREYYDTGSPSPWTALKTLAKGVCSSLVRGPMIQRISRPVRVEALLDNGERWEMQPFFSMGAGTIPDLGLGFRPFYRAHEQPGFFHFQGIRTTPLGFCVELPRIHRAQPLGGGKAIDVLARSVILHTEGGPLPYMIDGDLIEHPRSEMTLRIGPVVRIATMN